MSQYKLALRIKKQFLASILVITLTSALVSSFQIVNVIGNSSPNESLNYVVLDTGQNTCYDNKGEISCPSFGETFYGQDAHYHGTQFAYQDNGDGTVTDLNTDLMWQKTPDFDDKMTWNEAIAYAESLELAGYKDWRLPTIKELYSLIDFNGDSKAATPVPYIDTDYFDFRWGDVVSGDRLIDAQYWSNTTYVGKTMRNEDAAFGVNFADGRIKGYPTETGPRGKPFARYVRCVRGGDGYGVNNFSDNGDGTITDLATGLMWMKADSEATMDWEEALAYAENKVYAGYHDWRLPNAKELQSIVDYTRAPDATDPSRRGPAIDPIFDVTETESWFWTSTTHLEGPGDSAGVYIAFGMATGFMTDRMDDKVLLNVHGAGAQRSDPKGGNPDKWSGGLGPQGDVIRINNYVRCVRGRSGIPTKISTTTSSTSSTTSIIVGKSTIPTFSISVATTSNATSISIAGRIPRFSIELLILGIAIGVAVIIIKRTKKTREKTHAHNQVFG